MRRYRLSIVFQCTQTASEGNCDTAGRSSGDINEPTQKVQPVKLRFFRGCASTFTAYISLPMIITDAYII
jgi:hypothetical protein